MTRTQIQLPDPMYHQLKALAEAHDWTLAEAVRRGVELLLTSYPQQAEPQWKLPEPLKLGAFEAPPEDWRRLANER